MFPDGEDASVVVYADVVQAVTLASDLLDKALMKLSVSGFDISLPSQHLLFVFDAPKWLLARPASVPAFWNEEVRAVARRGAARRRAGLVALLSGTRRASAHLF